MVLITNLRTFVCVIEWILWSVQHTSWFCVSLMNSVWFFFLFFFLKLRKWSNLFKCNLDTAFFACSVIYVVEYNTYLYIKKSKYFDFKRAHTAYVSVTLSSNIYGVDGSHIDQAKYYMYMYAIFTWMSAMFDSCLGELQRLYIPSRSLRPSSDTCMFMTPSLLPQNLRLSHFLLLYSPHLEQSPPRHQDTLSSFKNKLKAFLFSKYFN